MLIIAVAAADGGYLVENGKPDITVRKTSYQTSPDLSPSSNSNPSEAVKQCKKRTKWSKQTDPSLEQKYGSKEMALDAEEFSEKAPSQLCAEDQEHWQRLRPGT
ncbi:hypothetical protein HO173_000553 [Letharia columbiana]|uniref:Uncharacterized protein n=1 Tax=Letharia columbiana TaxID=112416 RepID=A0A8H6LAH0_9LECA|nr:uncharacterized protein HO173_000553 [Letharia columbiana]KAF6241841.1 hypothetical protein HO173_000553 [Letharia columbiana]